MQPPSHRGICLWILDLLYQGFDPRSIAINPLKKQLVLEQVTYTPYLSDALNIIALFD